MCSRYSIATTAEKLEKRFNIEADERFQPRYNASPTQLLPVITSESPQGFSFFYWGMSPPFSKDKTLSSKFYNSKSETIAEKQSQKNALLTRRCLVPANGYYEWKQLSKKSKIPYYVALQTQDPFAFAGIWEEFEDEHDETVHTFSIMTTAANKTISSIHDRMPVILTADSEKIWLDEKSSFENLMQVLSPYPSEKIFLHTVSSRVNSLANDGPELIKPAPASDQFGNYTLFN